MSDDARKRMFERGVSVEEIAEVIRKGRKWREDGKLHATLRGIEAIYRVINSEMFVITVHYR